MFFHELREDTVLRAEPLLQLRDAALRLEVGPLGLAGGPLEGRSSVLKELLEPAVEDGGLELGLVAKRGDRRLLDEMAAEENHFLLRREVLAGSFHWSVLPAQFYGRTLHFRLRHYTFKERTQKLGAEYSAINPIDDLHINPGLTMGENIGDNSGLMQAYRAYRISLGGKGAPVIGGLTGDQRFFIGYAQIWRSKLRDATLRNQLLTNAHSPAMARASVPLTNNDAFMKAFDVKPGDKMWRDPKDRVKIW